MRRIAPHRRPLNPAPDGPDMIAGLPGRGGMIWQGPRPPEGETLVRSAFGALALCAVEHQPPSRRFPGLRVIRAPIDDAMLTDVEWRAAQQAGRAVAQAARAGASVLVTCNMGLNRSGIVIALALVQLGLRPAEAIDLIREKRRSVRGIAPLSNRWFVDRLLSLGGRSRAA